MALKIYLDSNQCSRFAGIHRQSDAVRATFDALTKWVDEGRVEVRYSSVNVLEAAPLNPEANALAQHRFDAMYRLCRALCLIDVVRLLKMEATNSASVDVPSNVGDWHPVVYDLKMPGAEEVARAMLDGARGAASSRQMRAFENRFFDAAGELKASARPQVAAFLKDHGGPPFSQYPVSKSAVDTYYSFVLGNSTKERLTDALVASFSDLNRWGEWCVTNWHVAHSLTKQLREPAEKIADRVRRLAAMLRVLFDGIKETGLSPKEIERRIGEKANPDAMRNQLLEVLGIDVKSRRQAEDNRQQGYSSR